MTFMSNAAGRERDQFGTRMSAGLDWSLGRMPLPFLICGERHALWQKSAMQSLSWLCLVINTYDNKMYEAIEYEMPEGRIL